jgi:hypothetical protein
MLSIIQDAGRNPKVFCWFGAIPASEISEWLINSHLRLPRDLFEFWRVTGGAELFESETIFRPPVSSLPNQCFISGDDTNSRNLSHKRNGLPDGLFLFQDGAFLSAVRLHDQKFVTFAKNYVVEAVFDSMNEWYEKTLRAEFGLRYGLNR